MRGERVTETGRTLRMHARLRRIVTCIATNQTNLAILYLYLYRVCFHVSDTIQYHTVCPKVPYTSKVCLFSAVCGWIPKPFDLLIATAVRFDLVYNNASIVGKYPCKICKNFWTSFAKNEISGKSKKI